MTVLAVDYQSGIESAWSNVVTFVPKLVAGLLILLVGYVVARAVAGILNKLLGRVGFDRVVERGGVRQVLARSGYDASDILAKLVFWTIMLLVLQLAFGVFGANPVSDLLRDQIRRNPDTAYPASGEQGYQPTDGGLGTTSTDLFDDRPAPNWWPEDGR